MPRQGVLVHLWWSESITPEDMRLLRCLRISRELRPTLPGKTIRVQDTETPPS